MRIATWALGMVCLAVAMSLVACSAQEGAPQTKPVDAGNRWYRSAPSGQGMDDARLRSADAFVRGHLSDVSALLVVRHGRIVLERYYGGAARDTRAEIYSATKSVMSTLVGIALERGELRSLDQRLGELLPPSAFPRDADPRARRITLRDLLAMRSGFVSDEEAGYDYTFAPNWVRAMLARPFERDPGDRFAYDSGSSHLLSAILTRATGMSAQEYANRHLFGPLGIDDQALWLFDPQGNNVGGWGLHLSARELARLGQLLLNRGRWGGEQIVPADWVAAATAAQVETDGPEDRWGFPRWREYGYQVWRYPGAPRDFAVAGNGGQFALVWPSLDLIVVTTAQNVVTGTSLDWDLRALLEDHILPAVRERAGG